jgi:hypothetical protein
VRLFILVRLNVDAIAVFAPDEGAALMRSVVHGFGWGIGHEIAHSVFGHRRWWESWRQDEERSAVGSTRAHASGIHQIQQGLMRTIRLRNPDKCVGCRIPPT